MVAVVGLLMVALIWSMFSTDAGYLIWGYMMIAVVTILMGAYECLDILVQHTGSCVEPVVGHVRGCDFERKTANAHSLSMPSSNRCPLPWPD